MHTGEFLGERLFHFWPHQSEERAFAIFESIIQKGLLLSRGNKTLIERFPFFGGDGLENPVHLPQKSRVCFTDIPEDKLSRHTAQYGRCAVGFERRTILAWGGFPVLYLPNHPHPETLEQSAAGLLYWLELGALLLEKLPDFIKANGTAVTIYGKHVDSNSVEQQVETCRQAIHHVSSYVKAMSPTGTDDHSYLYEREWRIVSGVQYAGRNPFRSLTVEECDELCATRPEWREPLQHSGGYVYDAAPLINSFHFFNGIPDGVSVGNSIAVILAPSQPFAEKVRQFVCANSALFCSGKPEIRVLS